VKRDFCAEGSAEIAANLSKVSKIERDLPRKKIRTIYGIILVWDKSN
jgi:hypothetical protein